MNKKANLIAVGILAAFLVLIVCALEVVHGWGFHTTMTKEKAVYMLNHAGGVEKINDEAKAMFAKYGSNDFRFLYESDLKNLSKNCIIREFGGHYSGYWSNLRANSIWVTLRHKVYLYLR